VGGEKLLLNPVHAINISMHQLTVKRVARYFGRHPESYQKVQHTSSKWRTWLSFAGAYFIHINYFFSYRKTKTPLAPLDNSNKTKVKNLKYPLILGKKIWPWGLCDNYTIQKMWKSENALQTLAVLFFFSKSIGVITLCNKHV